MSATKPVKFQLEAPLTTEQQKKFDQHRKNLDLFFSGLNRSKADMLGYAFLIGNELNAAKDVLPHGEFEAFVDKNYDLPKRTQIRWRDLSKSVIERANQLKSADTKSATVALLKSPAVGLLNKKKFSEKERASILQIVPEIMERKGMVQFIEDCKLMREPKHQTHTPPKPLTPEQQTQAEREQAEAMVDALIGDITLILAEEKDVAPVLTLVSPKKRKELLDAAVSLNNKLRELDKSK